MGGPEEAAAHYLVALELLQVTPLPDHVDLGRLVARTAAQLTAAGHPGRAMRVVRSQLDALPPDAAALTRGQMLAALADALGLMDSGEALSPITTQALELIPAHAGDARARALASHALALARDGDLDRSHDAASGAVELADRLDLPRLAKRRRGPRCHCCTARPAAAMSPRRWRMRPDVLTMPELGSPRSAPCTCWAWSDPMPETCQPQPRPTPRPRPRRGPRERRGPRTPPRPAGNQPRCASPSASGTTAWRRRTCRRWHHRRRRRCCSPLSGHGC